jgi:DtxR family transcriptional regulator, Mn-dependent transcriptional regulator
MKISESAQEQLEMLWLASEEGSPTDNPPVKDLDFADDYSELSQLNLVNIAGNHLELTPQGKQEAALAIRRHRLAERLIADVLAVEESLMEERACTLEHALFDGVDESICTLLGHPQVCPHGKPIPPGACCKQMRNIIKPIIAPLSELNRGQRGRIAYLHMHDPQHLHKIMAMGIVPGVSLTVKETYPSYVFQAGYSQFAVDNEIAMDIYVRLNT